MFASADRFVKWNEVRLPSARSTFEGSARVVAEIDGRRCDGDCNPVPRHHPLARHANCGAAAAISSMIERRRRVPRDNAHAHAVAASGSKVCCVASSVIPTP